MVASTTHDADAARRLRLALDLFEAGDLAALIAVAGPAELDRARVAVRLISERGFDRGRDLGGALETLLVGRGEPSEPS